MIRKAIRSEGIVVLNGTEHLWGGRGGTRISGKGVNMYQGVGVRYAYFIYFYLNIL